MKKLITLTIALTLVCGLVIAEEAPENPIVKAFESLDYNPTDAQIEEFYSVLKTNCRLVPPVSELRVSGIQKQLRDVLGFSGLTWPLVPYPELLKDKFERRCDVVAALRKYYAFCLCLMRLAIEGEDSDENNPVSKLVRSEIALILESFYKNRGTDATMTDGRREHREWFSACADELNKKYGYRKCVYDEIARIEGELAFAGKDKWEKLTDWKDKFDACQPGKLKANAFLDWLFKNFSLEDIASREIPDSVSIVGETFVTLLDKYIKKEFLSPSDAEWKNEGKGVKTSTFSFNARLNLAMMLLAPKIMTGEIRQAKCAPFFFATLLKCGQETVWSYRTPAISKVYDPLLLKSQECYYRQNYKLASGNSRLKKIDEGEGGPAWFMSYSNLTGETGKLRIEDDFIHPTIYYITEAITGYDTLISYGKEPRFYKYMMDQTGSYKWHPYSHFEMEDPTPQISMKIDTELEYDITKEGMIKIVQGEMGSTFFEGTNLAYEAYRAVIKNDGLKAGVFHHFAQTKWELYTIWNYDCMLDYSYFERPICVLVVLPDQESYDRSIVGLYSSDFNCAQLYCGAYYRTQRMWTAKIYEKDKVNSLPFDTAHKLTLSLDDYKDQDRWNKAMEEKKKYEESIKDEIYW